MITWIEDAREGDSLARYSDQVLIRLSRDCYGMDSLSDFLLKRSNVLQTIGTPGHAHAGHAMAVHSGLIRDKKVHQVQNGPEKSRKYRKSRKVQSPELPSFGRLTVFNPLCHAHAGHGGGRWWQELRRPCQWYIVARDVVHAALFRLGVEDGSAAAAVRGLIARGNDDVTTRQGSC
jgi:hypothetical protein